MEKSPVPKEITRSFDNAALTITRMKEDAAALAIKFGTSSKIYKERLTQVETLAHFHSAAGKYIEHLITFNIKLGAECIAMDLSLMQEQHALSFRQAAEILGYKFSEEYLIKMELVDTIINDIRKGL